MQWHELDVSSITYYGELGLEHNNFVSGGKRKFEINFLKVILEFIYEALL